MASTKVTLLPLAFTVPPKLLLALSKVMLAAAPPLLATTVVSPLMFSVAFAASVIAPPVLVAFSVLAVTLPSVKPPVASTKVTLLPLAFTVPTKSLAALLSVMSPVPAASALVPVTFKAPA